MLIDAVSISQVCFQNSWLYFNTKNMSLIKLQVVKAIVVYFINFFKSFKDNNVMTINIYHQGDKEKESA